ncbi:MAG: Fic family protein [Proteobacteria bacterium]|nr:Fic family protein [Pseudomonadota bacterium]
MADKITLFRYLKSRPSIWLSAAEIKSAVSLPDRTLRRWLNELVLEGALERRGNRKATRYQWQPTATANAEPPPTSPAQKTHPHHGLTFSPANAILIERIKAPIYTRSPVTYSEEWLEEYEPNKSAYLAESTRRELHSLGKRSPLFAKAGTYIQKIYDRLLIDFSFNSSRLEGNTYSLADTERLVLLGAAAPGKPNAERIMILNHKEAIRYLVQHINTLTADEETIRTLHYLLADSLVAAGAAGQIREDSVLVSGTTYTPLEGKERLRLQLLRLLEKARAIADPFEQSFFLLAHLSYLQAFVDVNKRTARLASIIPLIRGDYVPQSFVDIDQAQYLEATIAMYELREAGPLAEVYAWSYRRTCQRYDTNVMATGFDEIAALYRQQRRALVSDLVRQQVPPTRISEWVLANIPSSIETVHREKFLADVLAEVENLDSSRIGGLGITRQELENWQKLHDHDTRTTLRDLRDEWDR